MQKSPFLRGWYKVGICNKDIKGKFYKSINSP